MANTLFLWLEGPIQSWGERARWSMRDSATEPTKSGVVGLLACALGLDQDEDIRALSQRLHVGARCDRPGMLLKDYQTIQGPWLGGTQLSDRYYLCDATFLVAVQSDDAALIEQLEKAIQNPVWPIFLGRKSCPPCRPPFDGTGDYLTMKAALESVPATTSQQGNTVQVRAIMECPPDEGTRRRDEIDSRSRRTFLPRYTFDVLLTVQVQPEVP
jgi:CRISPR system Cascade subunit CasD